MVVLRLQIAVFLASQPAPEKSPFPVFTPRLGFIDLCCRKQSESGLGNTLSGFTSTDFILTSSCEVGFVAFLAWSLRIVSSAQSPPLSREASIPRH